MRTGKGKSTTRVYYKDRARLCHPMPPEEKSWKGHEEQVKYLSLQAKEGDLAIFLLSGATENYVRGRKVFYRSAKLFDVGERRRTLANEELILKMEKFISLTHYLFTV